LDDAAAAKIGRLPDPKAARLADDPDRTRA